MVTGGLGIFHQRRPDTRFERGRTDASRFQSAAGQFIVLHARFAGILFGARRANFSVESAAGERSKRTAAVQAVTSDR